jgi:DNA-binding MarR family transcriptional regulator
MQTETQTRWLDEREARAWRGFIHMSELLRAQLGRDLQGEMGVSDADYVILVMLSEAESRAMRMTDLASELLWSKSRLSHQVSRMEERGLVERANCPSDARGSFARLTDAGFDQISRAAPSHVASVRRHLIDHLSGEQLDALAEVAEKVVEHLRSVSEPLRNYKPKCGLSAGDGDAAGGGHP